MQEIWRDIPKYEGLYQVSNLGSVRTLSFRGTNLIKPIKASPTNCGYYKVQLYKGGEGKMFYVHRLVALAFIPNPHGKKQINHIDGNKANNCVSNLEWASASDNQLHAITHGLREASPMIGKTGDKSPHSKPVLQYDACGKFVAEWAGTSTASSVLSISRSSISACLNGKSHTAGGFLWRFKNADDFPLYIDAPTKDPSSLKRPKPMRKIKQLSLTGNLIRVWDNYIQLTEATGYDNGNIYKAINGKLKSAYGYKWEYA